MLKKILVIILFMMAVVILPGCGGDDEKYVPGDKTWTIMYYGDADCDLEEYLMEDIAEMKAGFVNGYNVNLIILIDRYDGYSNDSSVLGENFTDTRLYRITQGNYERLDGGTQFPNISDDGSSSYEANMGDAATLKKFIQYCKENYPATDYALIFSNHGGGVKKKSSSVSGEESVSDGNLEITKNICYDETSGDDFLYTGEISDTLTSDESVQLLGLDACFMSSVEFAYQFRNDNSNTGFKAEIMVASAPTLWGLGWDYDSIFGNLHWKSVDPTYMDSSLFGKLVVDTQKVSTRYYGPCHNQDGLGRDHRAQGRPQGIETCRLGRDQQHRLVGQPALERREDGGVFRQGDIDSPGLMQTEGQQRVVAQHDAGVLVQIDGAGQTTR